MVYVMLVTSYLCCVCVCAGNLTILTRGYETPCLVCNQKTTLFICLEQACNQTPLCALWSGRLEGMQANKLCAQRIFLCLFSLSLPQSGHKCKVPKSMQSTKLPNMNCISAHEHEPLGSWALQCGYSPRDRSASSTGGGAKTAIEI